MQSAAKLSTTLLILSLIAGCGSGSSGDSTQQAGPVQQNPPPAMEEPDTSPVLQINRNRNRRPDDARDNASYRTFDGSDNNLIDISMNESETHLARWADADYSDLQSSLAGATRPSPREISNTVSAQAESILNPASASDYLWQWGQFLDHDIDLTDGVDPAEPANIEVPQGDTHFDPSSSGGIEIEFNRSIYDTATGGSIVDPRQQLNEITGWIDASNVYGSDIDRALALRTNDGTGRLKTSEGELLPFNVDGLSNAGGEGAELFLAGDVRANEQLGLTALHTLFVREHNRLVAEFAEDDPNLSGEDLYHWARRVVSAQMQVITYHEFLPLLLGDRALRPYRGYDENIDASIANVFSTAAYRLGHSMLSPQILRLDSNGEEVAEGHLPLRDAFFSPQTLVDEGGIEPMLRGLAAQISQQIDPFVVDDVRNFLFGQPGSGGFDLVSLNIQRGRDHGLPSYNSFREALGLPTRGAFFEISSSIELQDRLADAYDSPNDIDVWVGGLAEDPVAGSMLGELFHTILVRQFEALRDGDRFWYEMTLTNSELEEVRSTTLADIIRRNTSIGDEISDNVFIAE